MILLTNSKILFFANCWFIISHYISDAQRVYLRYFYLSACETKFKFIPKTVYIKQR